jgi:predicted nuclease with TOPRIM domain
LRLNQITKLELRLKSLEERAKHESEKSYTKEEIELLDDEITSSNNRFDDIIEILQKIRREWITNLNSFKLKVPLFKFRDKVKKRFGETISTIYCPT